MTAVMGSPRTSAGGYRHPRPSTELIAEGLAEQGSQALGDCYELCRRLHAAHGRTYYFATRFLPAAARPHVWALYGFARYTDDLVDHLSLDWPPQQRRAALEAWSADVLARLESGDTGNDPVLTATLHTVRTLGIAHTDLRAFLDSMAMDLTVTRYATFDDLAGYMHGSAAVIGTMMLPVLGADRTRARSAAMDLGVAFQLTNFLRDVAEDWDRGRIYLPLEDLDRFGVTEWDFHARHVGPAFRRLLAFEIDRTRRLYRRAEDGWMLLSPSSRRCIRVAHRIYGGILDAIEAADHQVFEVRARVSGLRKAAIAAKETLAPSSPGSRCLP